jgi:hypothetical protein
MFMCCKTIFSYKFDLFWTTTLLLYYLTTTNDVTWDKLTALTSHPTKKVIKIEELTYFTTNTDVTLM